MAHATRTPRAPARAREPAQADGRARASDGSVPEAEDLHADHGQMATPRRSLRWALVASDLAAITAGTGLAFALSSSRLPAELPLHTPALVATIVVAGYWVLRSRSLYLARIAGVRSIELERLLRATATLGLIWGLLEMASTEDVAVVRILIGSAMTFGLLVIGRGVFRAWLRAQRAVGRLTRPVLVIGTNDSARHLLRLLTRHPELGFAPVGVVGDRDSALRNELGGQWLGDESVAEEMLRAGTITGAVIAAGALEAAELDPLVRSLTDLGGHIHLSPAVRGIDHHRMRAVHLAYEPLYYLEQLKLQRHQVLTKRAMDVVLAAVGLVLVSPLLAATAVWIKLHDRGPVLFRQERVGRGGERFTMLKLRTMRVSAEDELDQLQALNQRNGPLFKLDADPRVTRPGRVLRALSIDELPQLLNVLRGHMSLVGPRPALASETERFGERMQKRTLVLPGITGLWQVEARDNPSFEAYERLDLFYVENWSVFLDVCILLGTAESELARLLRKVLQPATDEIIDLRTPLAAAGMPGEAGQPGT